MVSGSCGGWSSSTEETVPSKPVEFLSDTLEEGQAYIKPNYIETTLSKDKKQECRDIVRTINEYGVSQRQKLFLIHLLALELENRTLLTGIAKAVGDSQNEIEAQKKRIVLEENGKQDRKSTPLVSSQKKQLIVDAVVEYPITRR